MASGGGGGYPGSPSAPSAPPAPSAYGAQQAWQQPNFNSGAPNYSSAPPPSSYSSTPSSLAYSGSQRYNSQSSFGGSAHAPTIPTATPYTDPQHALYGQSQPPTSYGQQGRPQSPAGYGQTNLPHTPHADPSNLSSSYQSQPPSSYGRAPSSYGQPQPSTYGQPPQPSGYGQPPSPSSYGQAPQYGQSGYAQQSQYSAGGYPPSVYGAAYGQSFNQHPKPKVQFPPGTDPEIIRAFELGDIDGSGAIDAGELGRVLSSGLPFSTRTVNLMLHLYSGHGANKIGPIEFTALWKALKEWKVCFERSDRDRSGTIDYNELRDGLLSMGYAISPSLLTILISKYDRTGQAQALDYDNFVECGFVVKGLTDRFKAKDVRLAGSATLDYESFMTMVLPFIVA
ncbi:unnamed protein product [Calypogeia fissa]